MASTVQGERAVVWPLARRVAAGLARPGGAAMARRALEGAGLDAGARVVELAPGLGLTSAQVLERTPRSWTAVEPDPLAAEHLERGLAAQPGRHVVREPVDATGLEEASASVVLADALLSTLPDGPAEAVLAEAARLLRAGGRVAVHDLGWARGAHPDAAADLDASGLTPRSEGALRAMAEAAGLVVVGSLARPLALPAQRELMREAGPRTALRITRELARAGEVRSAATRARHALERRATDLRSVLVVAEKPLILGLRRPPR